MEGPLTFDPGSPDSELPQHHHSLWPLCGLLSGVSAPRAELRLPEPKKLLLLSCQTPILGLLCGQLGHLSHPGPFLPGTTGVGGSVVDPAAPSGASCSGCPWWNWAGHCGNRENHARYSHFGQQCPVALASFTHPWAPGHVMVRPSPGMIPLPA